MRLNATALFLALGALVLALPAVAGAADRSPAPAVPPAQADGTLTVRSANGVLTLSGRGSVIGQVVGKARLLIEDPDPTDGIPVVSGYERAQRQSRTAVLYTGSDLRFRVLGGQYKLRLTASGISLSFVGKGTVTLAPLGTADDGSYSLDGGDTYRDFGVGTAVLTVTGGLLGQPPAPTGLVLDRP